MRGQKGKPGGVRLLHDSGLTNCIVTVEHPYIRLSEPQLCPTCGVWHRNKTFHLWIDASGATIVSHTVFEHLCHPAIHHQFRIENEVKNPPSATLDMRDPRQTKIIREQPRIQIYQNVGV